MQQPTETQDSSVDKPLIVPPTDDSDTEIDFKNAKSPDDIKVRKPKQDPIDPTAKDKKDNPDAVDPKSAEPGRPKKDVKFDVDSLRKSKEEKDDVADTSDDDDDDDEVAEIKDPALNSAPAAKAKREYTGIPELDDILSELPNAKYNTARKFLPELFEAKTKVSELEKQLSERPAESVQYWYDHPEGYSLDEGYRKIQQDFGQAEFERTHFERQLNNIEAGEAWQDLVGYSKDGTPVFEKIEAREDGRIDSSARARILGMVAKYGSLQQDLKGRLTQHRNTFSESAKRGGAELQEVEKKIFPRWMDQKTLTKEDSAALDLVRGMYPRHMQSHPAIKHTGMAFRDYQRLAEVHGATLKENAELKQELSRIKSRTGKPLPTGGRNGSGSDNDDDDVIDLKKLNREFSPV